MISNLRRTAWTHLRRLTSCQSSIPNRYRSGGSDDRSVTDIEFTKRLMDLPESERFGSYAKKFSVSPERLDILEKMSNVDEQDQEMEEAIEDVESHVRLSPVHAPKSREYFLTRINGLIKEEELDDAKNVFYKEMLEDYRVKPTTHICNKIMELHSRLGEAQEARKLLKKMIHLKIHPDNLSFGLAYQAFSYSNDIEFSSEASRNLYDFLCRNDFNMNYQLYSRIIMCFSRNGSLTYMMRALDDMFMRSRIRPDNRIFLYILSGCRLDKEKGAGIALEVWQRFKQMRKVTLTHKHFNLLVKCLCECGLGDVKQLVISFSGIAQIDPKFLTTDAQSDEDLVVSNGIAVLPDNGLKFSEAHIDSSPVNFISRQVLTTNPDELHRYLMECSKMPPKYNISLIGGIEGLLHTMENEGLDINLHIITTLLHAYGYDEEFKKYMLDLAESKGLEKDLALYNELISSASTRLKKEEILKELTVRNIKPDIITEGAYSKGMSSLKDVRSHMNALKRKGVVPNVVMFHQLYGSTRSNFQVKKYLLERMLEYGVNPHKRMIEFIENEVYEFRELWLKYENDESVPEAVTAEHIRFSYLRFIAYYRRWLEKMPLEEIEC